MTITKKNKIKVLCITQFGMFYGGGEKSFFEAFRYLSDNDKYDISIIVPANNNSDFVNAIEKTKITCIKGGFDDRDSGNPVLAASVKNIVDLIIEHAPDVVVTNLYYEPSMYAAALTNTPHIYMDRGLSYLSEFKNCVVKLANFSNEIIANSEELAKVIYKNTNKEPFIVWSYVRKPDIRLKDTGNTRIIIPTRINRHKNTIELLMAIRKLRDSMAGFNTKTIIFGTVDDYGYYTTLSDFISENNLSDLVEINGYQKDPWGVAGKKDIYVSTSTIESVGRSSMEAVKLGIPIILSDIPGHYEMIKKIGVRSYKLGNTTELADEIKSLLLNFDHRKKEAIKQARIAEEEFSEEACNKDLGKAINQATNRDNPAKIRAVNDILLGKNILEQEVDDLKHELAESREIINSVSSKIGRLVTFPFRRLVGLFQRLVK